jgi:formylglycine-generating enzyme required for sulfatase activity
MRLALIPPGTFWMGAPEDEERSFDDERPVHPVTIGKPFYLGVFPVTQAEYEHIIGRNPSHFCASGAGAARVRRRNTSRHPVEDVTWDDAAEFCTQLSALAAEKKAGRKYRLPTEAEWEYACRAGLSHAGPFHFGPGLSGDLANMDGRVPYGGAPAGPFVQATTPVDAYPPNAWSLYDLHGNVSEWCADWFDEDYYSRSPRKNPAGADEGDDMERVLRGGSWHDHGEFCRAAFRYNRPPDESRNEFGLRVLLESRRPRTRRKG